MCVCRRKFHDELALLQRLRHPNIVQFLGAVTQSNPMMIVTEYLPRVWTFSVTFLSFFSKPRSHLMKHSSGRFA